MALSREQQLCGILLRLVDYVRNFMSQSLGMLGNLVVPACCTVWARTSGESLFVVLPVIAPPYSRVGTPTMLRRFKSRFGAVPPYKLGGPRRSLELNRWAGPPHDNGRTRRRFDHS